MQHETDNSNKKNSSLSGKDKRYLAGENKASRSSKNAAHDPGHSKAHCLPVMCAARLWSETMAILHAQNILRSEIGACRGFAMIRRDLETAFWTGMVNFISQTMLLIRAQRSFYSRGGLKA